jgi:hypothetical protein
MVPLPWQGMVVCVWVLARFYTSGVERESGKKKHFKNLLLPCLCIRREEGEQCRSKRHYFDALSLSLSLFFSRKGNVIGKNPKNGL